MSQELIEQGTPEQSAECILKGTPNNIQLCWIINYTSSHTYKEEAALRLLAQNPSNKDLRFLIMIQGLPEIRKQAWAALKPKATLADLFWVMTWCPYLVDDATRRSLEIKKPLGGIEQITDDLKRQTGG